MALDEPAFSYAQKIRPARTPSREAVDGLIEPDPISSSTVGEGVSWATGDGVGATGAGVSGVGGDSEAIDGGDDETSLGVSVVAIVGSEVMPGNSVGAGVSTADSPS